MKDRGEPIGHRNGLPIYKRLAPQGNAQPVRKLMDRTPTSRLRRQQRHRAAVRDIVMARAGGRCEGCGFRTHLEYAHRWPKRMGGTRRQEDPRHALALCHDCHRWQEGEPESARVLGWTVDGNSLDAPVRLPRGRVVRLTVEGGYEVL